MVNNNTISPMHAFTIYQTLTDEQVSQIADTVVEELKTIVIPVHKEILSTTEVEDLLNISHTTRIDWTKQGILTSYSLGGRKIYYKYSEVKFRLKKIHHKKLNNGK